MLKEIRSELFTEKVITFHENLNVILGDEKATNSIGKSTLLMVIDFVFGGNSFIEHNKDVVQELGHHDYFFCFLFDNELYHFKRGTYKPDLVYKCNEDYSDIEAISIEEFTSFLKLSYNIEISHISFRSFIGLYSRIWGKDNLNVNKPLHVIQNKSAVECIYDLIKIFNKYDEIYELAVELKKRTEEKESYGKAQNNKIIPKINRHQYIKNEEQINKIENEIKNIKSDLAKYATNINEIVNKEILDLKKQKDELLSIQLNIDNKLQRIQRNLSTNKYLKSKHLKSLQNFFPNVNIDKLEKIESFHDGITRILKSELLSAEKDLNSQAELVREELALIDNKISQTLSNIDNPSIIVDRVYEIANILQQTKRENTYFENQNEVIELVKDLKTELNEEKLKVLSFIENLINDELHKIVSRLYIESRKAPVLTLSTNNYKYEVFEDTGTGKAYSNLLVFDIAIFKLTELPILIHDSVLFKNIENIAVSNIVKEYLNIQKQIFISLDEIQKYGEETNKILNGKKILNLNNEKLLYIKDWRKKESNI